MRRSLARKAEDDRDYSAASGAQSNADADPADRHDRGAGALQQDEEEAGGADNPGARSGVLLLSGQNYPLLGHRSWPDGRYGRWGRLAGRGVSG
jgi:hypothetical protein